MCDCLICFLFELFVQSIGFDEDVQILVFVLALQQVDFGFEHESAFLCVVGDVFQWFHVEGVFVFSYFAAVVVFEFFNKEGLVFVVVEFEVGAVGEIGELDFGAGDALFGVFLRGHVHQWVSGWQNGVEHVAVDEVNNQISAGFKQTEAFVEKVLFVGEIVHGEIHAQHVGEGVGFECVLLEVGHLEFVVGEVFFGLFNHGGGLVDADDVQPFGGEHGHVMSGSTADVQDVAGRRRGRVV